MYEFPEEDLKIIEEDWKQIIQKIKDGKAHEISESDTMYLGACTKGANAESSFRKQPFSDIPAKQRAFCLKTSYMTQLVREYIGKQKPESLYKTLNYQSSFEDTIISKTNQYKNKSVEELCKIFSIDSKAKNLNDMIISRMLGIKGKISNTEEFLKANIISKTIRINESGKIKESMSFPCFKYTEIVNQEWEESDLYQMLSSTKFMFGVFIERDGCYYFDHIQFWNLPKYILDNDVKNVWTKTKEIVSKGEIVKNIKEDGTRLTNFPRMSENNYCHVRPHAKNADDEYPLPKTDLLTGMRNYTKHCFWLNSSFILSVVSGDKNE